MTADDDRRRDEIRADIQKDLAWAKRLAATGAKRPLKKETFACVHALVTALAHGPPPPPTLHENNAMPTDDRPPLLTPPADAPEPGSRWRHFKGETCTVLGVSRHTETGAFLVNYQKGNMRWSRPLSAWADQARPGTQRFTKETT